VKVCSLRRDLIIADCSEGKPLVQRSSFLLCPTYEWRSGCDTVDIHDFLEAWEQQSRQ
jgi:hypothetical protein